MANFSGLGFSAQAGRLKKPHVIAVKFKPGLKCEFEQAH